MSGISFNVKIIGSNIQVSVYHERSNRKFSLAKWWCSYTPILRYLYLSISFGLPELAKNFGLSFKTCKSPVNFCLGATDTNQQLRKRSEISIDHISSSYFILSRCILDFSVGVGALSYDWVRSFPFFFFFLISVVIFRTPDQIRFRSMC